MLGVYPLFLLWRVWVPLLQRVTFERSPKVTKRLLPHHSAPRLGSVCPHSGITPRAAATGRPCPVAGKPASCRFTRSVLPAFGQRGLTGRLRSRSKADQRHSGLQAGLSGVKQRQNQNLKPERARSNVGAGLPAMQTTRYIRHTEVMPSPASRLLQKSSSAFALAFDLASTTQAGL
jgi:hypothetical protein